MTRIYFIGGKSYGPFSSAYPVYSTQSETYAYTVIEDSGKSYFILADGSYLGKEYQYANNLFLSGKNGTRKTFQFQK